jgi:hypothetical protein
MDLQTESELTQDINSITLYINANFPELSAFMEEISISSGIDIGQAVDPAQGQEYYDSLEMLIKNYAISQVVI